MLKAYLKFPFFRDTLKHVLLKEEFNQKVFRTNLADATAVLSEYVKGIVNKRGQVYDNLWFVTTLDELEKEEIEQILEEEGSGLCYPGVIFYYKDQEEALKFKNLLNSDKDKQIPTVF